MNNQPKRGKMRRLLLALLLTGVLSVASFAAPGIVKTASACQANTGGC